MKYVPSDVGAINDFPSSQETIDTNAPLEHETPFKSIEATVNPYGAGATFLTLLNCMYPKNSGTSNLSLLLCSWVWQNTLSSTVQQGQRTRYGPNCHNCSRLATDLQPTARIIWRFERTDTVAGSLTFLNHIRGYYRSFTCPGHQHFCDLSNSFCFEIQKSQRPKTGKTRPENSFFMEGALIAALHHSNKLCHLSSILRLQKFTWPRFYPQNEWRK